MEEKAHIITERVFGSSRKIQFIGLEQVPTNTNNNTTTTRTPTAMNLSSTTTNNRPSNHVRSVDSLLNNDKEDDTTSTSSSNHNSMSIESLLSVEEDSNHHNTNYLYPRQSQSASSHEISVSSLLTSDNTSNYKRKHIEPTVSTSKKLKQKEKTIITCLHAAVAQKSYGSEKRFLCPPPIVSFQSPSHITAEQRSEKTQVSMSIIHENGEKILEQHSLLDNSQSGSFKYLHVTGTAKAKQFHLKVDVLPIDESTIPICSFNSNPVAIISKPSKKTAKSRNVSTCILANMPVSLFNRINSQTVRTKYMTSSNNMLCAKNTTWSPFDIIIVNQPKLPQPHYTNKGRYNSRLQLNYSPPQKAAPEHITYGTEIMLRDAQTGITSPPLIIRKVDKNRIAPCAYGPVSQMQKIALQLASTLNSQPIYLSASGCASDNTQQWLDYSPSRLVQPENMALELSYEQVEDYLCWTIVGIHKVQYELDESVPPSPYPLLTHIEYVQESHTLNVIGQHLIQAAPVPRLLDLWLGTHGPLTTKISKPPQPSAPHETHWTVQLPPLTEKELSLLLVRQDGLVYQTGKSLVCNDAGRWSVSSF